MAPKSKKTSSASSSKAEDNSSKKVMINEPRVFSYQEITEMTDQFHKLLGAGEYGRVYQGTYNNRNVAVKIYKLTGKRYWENERDALSSLDDSKNIVSLIGIQYDDGEHFSIVMNHVSTTLQVVLERKELEWKVAHKILLQLATAIQELSRKDFVVGDIKLDNVLLDQDYNVFLCDFGSARRGGKDMPTVNSHYAAKEVSLKGHGSYATDIFSFGVIMLQMIMKENKFGGVPSTPFLHVAGKQKRESSSKKEDDHISVKAKTKYNLSQEVVHKSILSSGCSTKDAATLAKLGIECADHFENRRPTVDEVIAKLRGLKS
ncbi:L-type lectin-domain containing receptor kinase IX.2-like [Henckelia pumila]|uniref:L-type lectin-domain containing receptor kinase IX.2-like n=1 Tax=Henckelia pumila TaxID=405737 RepID=UPI003C6DD117